MQAAGLATRLNIKVANRDLYGSDFIALLEFETEFKGAPQGWAVIERSRGGQLFGKPLRFDSTTGELDLPLERHLRQALLEAETIRDQVDKMVEQQVRVISSQLERLRLEKRRKQLNNQLSDEFYNTTC